jgi:hypothetical protein
MNELTIMIDWYYRKATYEPTLPNWGRLYRTWLGVDLPNGDFDWSGYHETLYE